MVGEVQRPRASQRGHLYFELIEKGERDAIIAKLDAVLWRTDHLRVRQTLACSQQEIADGHEIRCRCEIDFYPPGGRVQLVVREVDPFFTLGQLELRRRETLAALAAAGLLDLNRGLELPAVVLRVGLVTSTGSAAYHDFLSGLTQSRFGFQVFFCHATMQGREAEAEIVTALALLATLKPDVIVLVRGGGSRTDLAVFDSRTVAEAIARCPLPVLTGLGHEIDAAIADRVSHRALKTPTEVAAFLVERLERADNVVTSWEQVLHQKGKLRLERAASRLERVAQGVRISRLSLLRASGQVRDVTRAFELLSRQRLQVAQRWWAQVQARLPVSCNRLLERQREQPMRTTERLVGLAQGRLREVRTRLDGLARLCDELAPARVLARGYSMTFNQTGTLLRRPEQVRPGESITTRVFGGTFQSRVEEI